MALRITQFVSAYVLLNLIAESLGHLQERLNVGDKVTFDTDRVEEFMADTEPKDKAVQYYRKLVLAGVDQIGTVKEVGFSIVTVSYPDGWELPLPVKYLIVLPQE